MQDLYPETAWQLGVLRPHGPLARLWRALRNWSLRHAVTNVAVSERMAAHLATQAPRARIVRIYNWSDDHAGRSPPSTATALRAEANLGAGFVVGYCGNLGRAHHAGALHGALERWAAQPQVTHLMVGGGAAMEDLEARAAALRPANWRFLPYQPRPRLAELLATPDVHLVVLDPRVEGLIFPSKLAGILAVGRPVVYLGDRDSEVAEILQRHGCGLSVAIDDTDAYLGALERLRGDPKGRHAMGEQARLAFAALFARPTAMAQWRELIAGLARTPAATPAPLSSGWDPRG
jgi:colanic acid biosynthesis glycosyl transferase WcaI